MIKLLFICLTLPLLIVPSHAADQAQNRPMLDCAAQAPYGWPQIVKADTTPICRTAYALLHDNQAKIPIWVVYTLTPQHAVGCVARTNSFAPDQSLPRGQRSELADYNHSGFDQGHMANDGDMSWDPVVEHESFILSNMSPQAASINRGSFKLLETKVRDWAYTIRHNFTVYVGPIYNTSTDPKIGPNNVVVPHGFYKIVIDDNTAQVAGWVFPNQGNPGKNLMLLRMPVSQIQQLTGIQFNYPAHATELSTDQEWPVDFSALTQAKRQLCGAVDN